MKMTDEALRESEEKFSAVFHYSPDAFMLLTVPDGRIAEVNESALLLSGYSRGEVIGNTTSKLRLWADRGDRDRYIAIIRRKGRAVDFETSFRDRSGKIFPALISGGIIKLKSGPHFLSIIRDITERKKSEEALLESKIKLQLLYDSSSDAIMLLDEKGFFDCNKATLRLFGCATKEEFCSRHPADFSPPTQPDGTDSRRYARNNITRALKEGSARFEHVHRRLDGTDFPAEVLLDKIVLHGKGVLQARVFDITKRKKAEESFLRINSLNSALVENAPFGIMTIMRDGSVDYVNPALLRISGDSKANFKQMNVFKLPTYVRLGLAVKIRSCFNGKSFFVGSLEYVSHFSKKKTVRNFTGMPMLDEAGKVEKVMLFVEDITKMKEADAALRESEEKYRALVEATDTGFLILDWKGKVIDANAEYVRLTGRRRLSDILGKSVIEWTADYEKQKNSVAVAQCIKDGFIKDLVLDYVDEKGEITPVEINASVVGSGESIRIISLCRDIANRKKAEESLKSSEERYELVSKQTGQLIYDYDLASGKIIWSGAIESITGYSEKEFEKVDIRRWEEMIHSDDRKLAVDLLDKARVKGDKYFVQYRFRSKSGHYVFIHEEGVFLKDKSDKPYRMLGAMRDVSEQEMANSVLLENESRYRELVNKINSAVAVYEAVDGGKDFIIRECNPSAEKTEKIKKEDVIGKKVTVVFPGVREFGLLDVFRRVWKTGKPENHPISLYKDDHIANWRENYVYKLPSGEVIAVYDDVTEKKKSEEFMRLRTRESETINLIMSAANAAENLPDFLQSILLVILDFIGFEKGGIYIIDERTHFAELKCWKGFSDAFVKKHILRVNIDKKPFSIVLKEGKPVITDEYSLIHPSLAKESKMHALASMPLLSKEKIIGCINIATTKHYSFSEDEKKTLALISRETGIAIASLISQEELKSRSDELEKFNKLSVGRELKMVELKEKVAELESKLDVKRGKNGL
ncbi:MAG: PAS domain S-box protein [archaeon]